MDEQLLQRIQEMYEALVRGIVDACNDIEHTEEPK